MSLRTCTILAALFTSAAAEPAPDKARGWEYEAVTLPGGFVTRHGYLTETEIADPVLQARVRDNNITGCDQDPTFERKGVRWYEPVAAGGEKCAAVVYVAVCRGKKVDPFESERLRAFLLNLTPETPIPAHCGSTREEQDSPVPSLDPDQQQMRTGIGSGCDAPDVTAGLPMRIEPSTVFGVKSEVDPALADAVSADVHVFRQVSEGVITSAAMDKRERLPQFMRSGEVVQQGANISLFQSVARPKSGRGYCVTLTATQGSKLWRRTIVREAGTLSASPAEWEAEIPAPYIRDAETLAKAFRAALVGDPFVASLP